MAGGLAGPGHHPAGGSQTDRLGLPARRPGDTQPVEPLTQTAGLALAVCQFGMGEDDAEFVAAQPADNVGLAEMREDDRADLPQRFIARGMAEPVIDQLEPVKIEIDEAERGAVAGRQGDFAVELTLEGAAVVDRAERIMIGKPFCVLKRLFETCLFSPQMQHLFGERAESRRCLRVMGRGGDLKRGKQVISFRSRPGRRVALPAMSRRLPHADSYTPNRAGHLLIGVLDGPKPLPILGRFLKGGEMSANNPVVGVIMGSQSDWPVMKGACDMLDQLGVAYEAKIVSAHRTPDRLAAYAKSARERGLKVIVAGAGGAAHLPGMTAAMTPLPVLGVPVQSRALNGQDSLLSIVQMPKGVPVGTLAIGEAGAANAGILAASIIALGDEAVAGKLDAFRQAQTDSVGEVPEA